VSVTNEMLMSYADGELDAAGCAEVEEAMRDDASIERRIAQFREERRLLQAAYAHELDEPVPEKILAALREAPPANVADFKRRSVGSPPRTMRWRYTALAAGIVMAVGVGVIAWQRSLMIRNVGDAELAGGALARALSDQLSADANAGEVRVGLSFLAKSGA
jgi:anti-sigma factor RsiW